MKNIIKTLDIYNEICYIIITNKTNITKIIIIASEGRRKYRKGNQEYHITQGTDKGEWDCQTVHRYLNSHHGLARKD